MRYVDTDSHTVYRGKAGPSAPVIYVIDLPYHPFDLAKVTHGLSSTVVRLPVRDWNDSMTPWPAPRIRDEETDFGGDADATLAELTHEALPAIERAEGLTPVSRAICGYSLAGLFALYAFVRTDAFAACACLSGSLWYKGWVPYLRTLDFDATDRYAYLSVGSREKKAPLPIMRTVQDDMQACADILRAHGCRVDCVVGPGNHFQHQQERFAAGLAALDGICSVGENAT